MKKIRVKGKTVEEATENGSKILGIPKEDLTVKVISEGKSGLLGVFGGEEAEVEVMKKVSMGEGAKEVLQNILNELRFMAIAEVASEEDGVIILDVKGEDLGKVIGKDGAMLKALQIIVSNIVGRTFGVRGKVYVDAGGYRSKHEKALSRIAEDAAKDVVETGQEKTLPHMSPADRRIIHVALKANTDVETYSVGEGPDRKLVIAPKANASR